MRQRLTFGSIMIVVLVTIVLVDARLSVGVTTLFAPPFWRCGFLLTLLVGVLAYAASLELGRLFEIGGFKPLRGWAALISALIVITPFLQTQMTLGAIPRLEMLTGLSPVTLVLTFGFLVVCLVVMARKTTAQAVGSIATTLFICFYIGVLASFAMRIRFLDEGPRGAALLVYFILTVKCSDIGAFFTGSAIGRHKMIPWLSPGKTWEGAAGAVLGSVVMAELGMLLWGRLIHWLDRPPLDFEQALIFGVFMAVLGHLGDLVESLIKRDMGAKDSAKLVPAFGGLLDVLDSPLFAAPAAWLLLTLWV